MTRPGTESRNGHGPLWEASGLIPTLRSPVWWLHVSGSGSHDLGVKLKGTEMNLRVTPGVNMTKLWLYSHIKGEKCQDCLKVFLNHPISDLCLCSYKLGEQRSLLWPSGKHYFHGLVGTHKTQVALGSTSPSNWMCLLLETDAVPPQPIATRLALPE